MDSPVPAIFPREVIKDHQVGNLKLKKGVVVNSGAPILGYLPKYFEDPWKFIPERWDE